MTFEELWFTQEGLGYKSEDGIPSTPALNVLEDTWNASRNELIKDIKKLMKEYPNSDMEFRVAMEDLIGEDNE